MLAVTMQEDAPPTRRHPRRVVGRVVGWELRVQMCLSVDGRVTPVGTLSRVVLSEGEPTERTPRARKPDDRQLVLTWIPAKPAERVIPALGGRTRPTTVPSRRLTRREQETAKVLQFLEPNWDADRPKALVDCEPGGKNEARPCPWVSCRHHLAIETNEENGSIKFVRPGVELEDMAHTCVFDLVREAGPMHLKQIAPALNRTYERVEQLVAKAMQEVKIKVMREERLVRIRTTRMETR